MPTVAAATQFSVLPLWPTPTSPNTRTTRKLRYPLISTENCQLLYVCRIWGPIIRRRPAVWTNDCQNAASSFYFCRLWKYRVLMSEQCLLRLWRRRLYPNVIQEPRRANEGNVRRPTWTNNARAIPLSFMMHWRIFGPRTEDQWYILLPLRR